MSIEPWRTVRENVVADMHIFKLVEVVATSPRTGHDRRLAKVVSPHWVNVIAVTTDSSMVLVRQFRHGSESITLEIPGGLVDPGETAEEAAVRELREETGYTGDRVSLLGVVSPNPAFINNTCSTYLVEGCSRTHELALDDGEDIEVVTVPASEIPTVVARGEIDHALVICGFWWMMQRRPELFEPSA